MQIPALALFSLLPIICSALPSYPQQPLHLDCVAPDQDSAEGVPTVEYGWKGPGTYHVTNLKSGYALSIDTKIKNAQCGVWTPNDHVAQKWVIALIDQHKQHYAIISKATGGYVTSSEVKLDGGHATFARTCLPLNPTSTWALDFSKHSHNNGAVVFRSLTEHNKVFDESAAHPLKKGTPVITYSFHGGPNQAWKLEHIK